MSQNPAVPLLGTSVQWGYVVRDIQAAMRHWTEVLKVGPFIHVDPGQLECVYRGRPTDPRVSNGFAYYGDIQIELIQQLNDAPSPYKDFIDSGGEGLQHFGFWVPDYEKARHGPEAGGYEELYSVRLPGTVNPARYYEHAGMGAQTELLETTPQKTALYGAMKKVARTWDGSRPVRRYGSMADFAAEYGVPSWS